MKNFLLFAYIAIFIFSCKKKKEEITPVVVTPQLYEYKIKPSQLNTNITTYDNEHFVYLDTRVTSKNKLFIFFPGTFANPSGYSKILVKAASMGYHTIGLMYVNASDIYLACNLNADNTCFGNSRLEIFDGNDHTPSVSVNSDNCIKNRLIKLLQYLQTQYPTQNWGQYLSGADVNWSKCVLAGHSQGGGHAEYIGKLQSVDRVISFSSIDWNNALNISASWINQIGQTSPSKYYSFNHTQDELFSYNNVVLQTNQLGLSAFGAFTSIDSVAKPYNNSHLLYTRAIPFATVISPYHNITCLNSYVPQNNTGEVNASFIKAWEYLLGE